MTFDQWYFVTVFAVSGLLFALGFYLGGRPR